MGSQIKLSYICLFKNHKTQSVAFHYLFNIKYSLLFTYLAVENVHLSDCKNMHFTSNGHNINALFTNVLSILLHPTFKFHKMSSKKKRLFQIQSLKMLSLTVLFPSLPRMSIFLWHSSSDAADHAWDQAVCQKLQYSEGNKTFSFLKRATFWGTQF